jgi:hypothetical protein
VIRVLDRLAADRGLPEIRVIDNGPLCPGSPMGSQDSIVYVVDDDVRMREALRELFTSLNMASATFGSVAEYRACRLIAVRYGANGRGDR